MAKEFQDSKGNNIMKLTKSELQKIIKEEIDRFLDEDLTKKGYVPGDAEGQRPGHIDRVEVALDDIAIALKTIGKRQQAFGRILQTLKKDQSAHPGATARSRKSYDLRQRRNEQED